MVSPWPLSTWLCVDLWTVSPFLLLFCAACRVFSFQPLSAFPRHHFLLLSLRPCWLPPPSTVWLGGGGSHLWHLATRYSLVLGSFSLNLWHEANEPQLTSTLTLSSPWNKVMENLTAPVSWLHLQPYTSLHSSSPPSSSSTISLHSPRGKYLLGEGCRKKSRPAWWAV